MTRPASDAAPVATITVRGGRAGDQGILAAWIDGRLVWSADSVNGGPPYYEATIDAARIRELPRLLEADGVSRGTKATYTGPDATWTNMRVFDGTELFVDLGSWHEAAEARPGIVATAAGIQPLDGRTRHDVLAAQPADYREFRELWGRVRHRLLELVPDARDAHETYDHPWKPTS